METGTLKELNVKPGDVVECVEIGASIFTYGRHYVITDLGGVIDDEGDDWMYKFGSNPITVTFRIISRAAQPTPDLTAITTPFGLLDEATQEALRAHGGPYEYWYNGEWIEGGNVGNLDCWAWRVQPQPESETITCYAYVHPSGIISKIESDNPQPVRVTFNRINGVIDLASYKVEAR